MIKNHWYAITESDLLKSKPTRLRRFGHDWVLWRNSTGQLYCFEDRCPHRGTALSLGRVHEDTLECAYHGFRFDSKGQCAQIPAHSKKDNRCRALKAKTYSVRESEGLVWMWWGDPSLIEPELPKFPNWDKKDDLYTSISIVSPIGFCRTMEANLDFAHFYFVHRFMKIPGLGPFTEKFECGVKDKLITIRGRFKDADPKIVKGIDFEGSVLFPALAIYDAPGSVRGKNMTLVACSPVDEENTWLHLRIHFKKGRWAVLSRFYWKHIFFRFLFPIIHRQDLRIITAQQPSTSGARSDQLVSIADQGIIQYLQLWEKSGKASRKVLVEDVADDYLSVPYQTGETETQITVI